MDWKRYFSCLRKTHTQRKRGEKFSGASFEACKNLMSCFELLLFITLPYNIIAPSSLVVRVLYYMCITTYLIRKHTLEQEEEEGSFGLLPKA